MAVLQTLHIHMVMYMHVMDKVCIRKTMRGLHELEFCLWDEGTHQDEVNIVDEWLSLSSVKKRMQVQ
jgi:hypothetical protein